MPSPFSSLARVFVRRAALQDAAVSLAAVEWALKLFKLVGWSPAERRVAATLVAMVREARWAVEQLSRHPARRQTSDE